MADIQPLMELNIPEISLARPAPIELNNPGFYIVMFFLLLIFLYCVYIIYFSLTTRRKKIVHDYFPMVSVMVYSKDGGNIIRRIIDNLLKQNYPKSKYEIIVYDNASKDETDEICIEYKKKGLIKYLRAEKRYPMKGPLLDLAIEKLATGGILLMTDPDVIAEKDWILDIVQPFKDEKVGAVAGTIHCGNYYKSIITMMRAVEDEWRFVAPMLRDSETVFSVGANQALRRKAWEQTKFGTNLLDDLEVITKVIDNGWKSVGVSATGVEEEVETLQQYWRQRTRWYKVNINSFFGQTKKWKKFMEAWPHAIQLVALVLIITFLFSLNSVYSVFFAALDFAMMNIAMMTAFLRIKTGKKFIPFIPLYLTFDTLLFAATAIYVQTFGRFFHLTREVWPSLQGKYYHAGTKLHDWFFNFEEKVKDYTGM